ncbi:GD10873 [Drosophila simulans]|uniref:GD10873 n=1 Tax=Drosophila simulans TaxID=7240 RepID=B4QCU5_DROSI|nr:GD10873 [Drosophila simulans]
MFTKSMLSFSLVVALFVVCHASPVPDNNGKYTVPQQSSSDGKYRPSDDGKYHGNSQNEGRSGSQESIGKLLKKGAKCTSISRSHKQKSFHTKSSLQKISIRKLLFNSYLTENGIYGEEQAKLHHTGGTHAKGFYEYTGDDGKLYRVNYASNDGGFMPQGDHIHPIPDAIVRALKYVEEQHKINGGAQFDHRGFRINHMTKDLKAQMKTIHQEGIPMELTVKLHMLEHEIELAEEEEREEQAELERLRQAAKTH